MQVSEQQVLVATHRRMTGARQTKFATDLGFKLHLITLESSFNFIFNIYQD